MDDEVEMVLRMLIVFQVPADAAELIDELEQPRNAQGGVVERLAEAGIGHLVGSIHASAGKDQDAARTVSYTHLTLPTIYSV